MKTKCTTDNFFQSMTIYLDEGQQRQVDIPQSIYVPKSYF